MSNHIIWLMPVASQNLPTFIATLARWEGGGGGLAGLKLYRNKKIIYRLCCVILLVPSIR
jgi:hypothetical protein